MHDTRQQRWKYHPAAQRIMLAATCNHFISVVISVYTNRGDVKMKPVAYVTEDGKMLIMADSPNMLPADKAGLIPLVEVATAEASCDRAFIDGLKAGFSLGQTDDESGFQETLERYKREY
jgi:hypothetical protein